MTLRSVRPAVLSDSAAITALAQESFTEVFDASGIAVSHPLRGRVLGSLRQMWEETLGSVDNREAQAHTFVALEGQSVVGFASLTQAPAIELKAPATSQIPAGVELTNLYVHRSFRRSGHASRLLSAIVDTINPDSFRAWVSPGDTVMIRFIQGSGFSPAGLKRSFTFDEAAGASREEHLWWALRS